MKKFFILLIVAVMTALSTNAQGTFVSLQVDSLTYSLPSTVVFHGSYVGLSLQNGYTSAYIRIYVDGNFSNTAVVSPGNGNFTLSMSGFVSGQSYTYIPKVTFPFNDDGTSGTFVMPSCTFATTISPTGINNICPGTSVPLTITAPAGSVYQWLNSGVVIPGATFSTYTTNTSGNFACQISYGGCTETTPVVTVNTLNAIGVKIIPEQDSICLGGSVLLPATVDNSVGVTYSWSPATGLDYTNILNPTANPTTVTTYVVTAHLGQCVETDQITIFPFEHITVSGAVNLTDGFMLQGQFSGLIYSILVNGDEIFPKDGYNFSDYAVFDYSETVQPGSWIVIKTKPGCSLAWQFGYLGISSENLEENGKVFPNPSTDKFFVNLNTGKKCTAVVYNSFGQIVSEREVEGGSFYIQDLSSGFYTLKVLQDGNPIYLAKLIKQ